MLHEIGFCDTENKAGRTLSEKNSMNSSTRQKIWGSYLRTWWTGHGLQ